ncbi:MULTISPECIES: hypothetical protein [Rhizobium]|uniref:hypothetical protein n=1 Tax=Rhizobium TaxID=379 RepID=UPI001032324E|nr:MULTISPECIES: hypothetical protein [Rhizobium]MDV4159471.1 hypothetical protein [Rhizobium brockwellii]TAW18129.1 hypothetical protein ELI25_21045 [Rhizobium ruizarguesonis]TAY75821.1 hypothetical protein ELH84_19060 [Rhizobium ruizarguesonis]
MAKSNRTESKVARGRGDLSASFLVAHRRSLKRLSATPTSVYVAHPEVRRCQRAPAKVRSIGATVVTHELPNPHRRSNAPVDLVFLCSPVGQFPSILLAKNMNILATSRALALKAPC